MIRILMLFLTANLCGYVLSDGDCDCIWKAVALLIGDSSHPTTVTNDGDSYSNVNIIPKINTDDTVKEVTSNGDSIQDVNSFRKNYLEFKECYEEALKKCRKENDLLKVQLHSISLQTSIFMSEVDQKLSNISQYIFAQTSRIENKEFDQNKRVRRSRGKFIGCYPVTEDYRGFRSYSLGPSLSTTVDSCIQICSYGNYVYAGLHSGSLCSCGNMIGHPVHDKLIESGCNQPCSGNKTQNCGSVGKNAVYETGIEQYRIDEEGRHLPENYLTPTVPDLTTTTGSTNIVPIVVTTTTEDAKSHVADASLTAHRDKSNDTYIYEITGSNSGKIYGTTIYNDLSDLATSAVHSGFVQNNIRSRVVVQNLPGQSSYTSSTKHGITSKSRGEWFFSYCFISATPITPPASAPLAPENLKAYRDKVNQIFIFAITGSTSGTIYGTDIYTDDSDLATAAVHSGIVQNNVASTIMVQILSGQSSYISTNQNAITSKSYGTWSGSYSIISTTATTPSVAPPAAPTNLKGYRDKVNQFFTFTISGSIIGSIYGTGIYTDDSDLSTAAVHAGYVQNNEARIILVQILPGQSNYTPTSQNGITSKNYGDWAGSYSIISAASIIPPVSAPAAPSNLKSYRDKVNQIFVFSIIGSISGTIYGSTIYTDDSDLATVAVHSGYGQNNIASTIMVQILPGQSSYTSTDQNGVTSRSYGSWGGSYTIISAAG